ncbi:single-stranded DNA-binding protein [bacterium]|nr:single-stranded DNA-binding protein [bacterium]
MSAHAKLMQARIKLQGMELRKSGENKFAGYKYFELGDFLPYVQNIFNDLGLCSVVSFTHEMATLSIVDLEDGTVVTVTSPMADAQLKGAHPIQNLGAVESYQRRYLWMAAMEIVEHDIIDATAGAEPPPKPATKPAPKQEAKPPAKVEGKSGPWQISVTADKNADLQAWISVVMDAARIALGQAQSEKDVMDIFKVNRIIFDTLKTDAPEDYAALMQDFKTRKETFKEAA